MNKLWHILEIIETAVAAIGIPLFVISLIINIICEVAGFNGTPVYEITDGLGSFILNYVWPVWMLLFIFNGLHAVSFLLDKQNLNK